MAALCPVAFLISQNYYLYSVQQIVVSIGTIVIFCFFLYYTLQFLSRIIKKSNKTAVNNSPARKINLTSLISASIALLFCLLIYGILVLKSMHTKMNVPVLLLYLFILFFLGLIVSSFRSKPGAFILIVFLLTSLGRTIWGTGKDMLLLTKPHTHDSLLDSITFKKKPNIYFFLLESFHSRDALRKIYDANIDQFASKLENTGFTLYDPIYANYFPTTMSALSLFGMDHHFYYQSRGLSDMSRAASLSIGDNPAIRILRNNGYKITYINNSFLYREKSRLIDYSNQIFGETYLCVPIYHVYILLYEPIRFFFRLIPHVRTAFRNVVVPTKDIMSAGPMLEDTLPMDISKINELKTEIEKSEFNNPTFRFIYGFGASHTNNYLYRENSLDRKKRYKNYWLKYYPLLIKKGTSEIEQAIKYIGSKDPNAIIVLLGDHGAWLRARMVEYVTMQPDIALEKIKKANSDYGYTLSDLTIDVSSVFLAIKWPEQVIKSNLANPPLSHVNLFRYIFSVLAENKSLMEHAVPNNSYFLMFDKVYTTVKQGEVLKEWEVLEVRE